MIKRVVIVAIGLLLILALSGCTGPAGTGGTPDLLGTGGTDTPAAPQYYLNAVNMGKLIQSKYMTTPDNSIIYGRYAPYTKIESVEVRGYEDVDVPLWIGPTLRQVYGLDKFVVADIAGKYVTVQNSTTDIKAKAWILEFGSNAQATSAYATIDQTDVALLYHADAKRELVFSKGAAQILSSALSQNPADDLNQRFLASNTLRDTDIPYMRKELADTYTTLKKAYGTDTSKTSTTEIPGSTLRYNLINNLYIVSFTQQNLVVIVAGFVDNEQAEKPIVGTAGRINDLVYQQVLIYNAVKEAAVTPGATP
ncbi:MAG: hypothetical protein WCE94_08840 [Candidatus Methanoperedens sp.]